MRFNIEIPVKPQADIKSEEFLYLQSEAGIDISLDDTHIIHIISVCVNTNYKCVNNVLDYRDRRTVQSSELTVGSIYSTPIYCLAHHWSNILWD